MFKTQKFCSMCSAPAIVWAVLGSDSEVFLCGKCEVKMSGFIVECVSL